MGAHCSSMSSSNTSEGSRKRRRLFGESHQDDLTTIDLTGSPDVLEEINVTKKAKRRSLSLKKRVDVPISQSETIVITDESDSPKNSLPKTETPKKDLTRLTNVETRTKYAATPTNSSKSQGFCVKPKVLFPSEYSESADKVHNNLSVQSENNELNLTTPNKVGNSMRGKSKINKLNLTTSNKVSVSTPTTLEKNKLNSESPDKVSVPTSGTLEKDKLNSSLLDKISIPTPVLIKKDQIDCATSNKVGVPDKSSVSTPISIKNDKFDPATPRKVGVPDKTSVSTPISLAKDKVELATPKSIGDLTPFKGFSPVRRKLNHANEVSPATINEVVVSQPVTSEINKRNPTVKLERLDVEKYFAEVKTHPVKSTQSLKNTSEFQKSPVFVTKKRGRPFKLKKIKTESPNTIEDFETTTEKLNYSKIKSKKLKSVNIPSKIQSSSIFKPEVKKEVLSSDFSDACEFVGFKSSTSSKLKKKVESLKNIVANPLVKIKEKRHKQSKKSIWQLTLGSKDHARKKKLLETFQQEPSLPNPYHKDKLKKEKNDKLDKEHKDKLQRKKNDELRKEDKNKLKKDNGQEEKDFEKITAQKKKHTLVGKKYSGSEANTGDSLGMNCHELVLDKNVISNDTHLKKKKQKFKENHAKKFHEPALLAFGGVDDDANEKRKTNYKKKKMSLLHHETSSDDDDSSKKHTKLQVDKKINDDVHKEKKQENKRKLTSCEDSLSSASPESSSDGGDSSKKQIKLKGKAISRRNSDVTETCENRDAKIQSSLGSPNHVNMRSGETSSINSPQCGQNTNETTPKKAQCEDLQPHHVEEDELILNESFGSLDLFDSPEKVDPTSKSEGIEKMKFKKKSETKCLFSPPPRDSALQSDTSKGSTKSKLIADAKFDFKRVDEKKTDPKQTPKPRLSLKRDLNVPLSSVGSQRSSPNITSKAKIGESQTTTDLSSQDKIISRKSIQFNKDGASHRKNAAIVEKSSTDLRNKLGSIKTAAGSNHLTSNQVIENLDSNARGIKARLTFHDKRLHLEDREKLDIVSNDWNEDESFENLCNNVSELSNNSGRVTVYENTLDEEDIAKHETWLEKYDTYTSEYQNLNKKEDELSHFQIDKTNTSAHSRLDSSSEKKSLPFQSQPKHASDKNSLKIDESTTSAHSRSDSSSFTQTLKNIRTIEEDSQLIKSHTTLKTPSPILSRDPRLNRSSPIKVVDSAQKESPQNQPKTSINDSLSIPQSADPRLLRGNSRPRPSSPSASTIKDLDSTRIQEIVRTVDPRMRKRREREEAEKAVKGAKNISVDQEQGNLSNDLSGQTIESPKKRTVCDASRPPSTNKATVFDRLGKKPETSPEKPINVKKNLLDIIKARPQTQSVDNSINDNYPSDEEDSLKLNCSTVDDFLYESDEEDPHSSPRHPKFVSERIENATNKMQDFDQNVKQRLSGTNRRFEPITMSTKPKDFNAYSRTGITTLSNPPTTKPMTARLSTSTATRLSGRLSLTESVNESRSLTSNSSISTVKSRISMVQAPVGRTTINKTSMPVNFEDEFIKLNTLQYNQDMESFNTNQDPEEQFLPAVTFGNNNTSNYDHVSMFDNPIQPLISLKNDRKAAFFFNFCHPLLRTGQCNYADNCKYSHVISRLLNELKRKTAFDMPAIMDVALKNRFDWFILDSWPIVMSLVHKNVFSYFEKVYQGKVRYKDIIVQLLSYCLEHKLESVETFVKKIAVIIENGDRESIKIICENIKPKLNDGFCYETIRNLVKKAIPPQDMIELCMLQCLKRKKNQTHIKEVYELIVKRMSTLEKSTISEKLLDTFYSLVQRIGIDGIHITSDRQNEMITVMEPEQAPVAEHQRVEKIDSTIKTLPSTCNIQQPINSPLESVPCTVENTLQNNFIDYNLKKIDLPSDATSFTSPFHKRHHKLYRAVRNITESLDEPDYNDIWYQLDKMSRGLESDTELVCRAYYQILCRNILTCERHVTEVIRIAVKSSCKKSICNLFEVGVNALTDLADAEMWMMAYQLMNWVKILAPDEPKTDFVLICSQIYLANNNPVEALYLLQRTKLLRNNRDEWLTNDSVKQDELIRNKTVLILLKAISFKDPEKALYLFKSLLEDQFIFYFPIELGLFADKLSLLMLLQNRVDLVAELCHLAMEHNFTFEKETYQELICSILPFDEVLANQILEYAIHLGLYNDSKIREGYTTLIIDLNFVEEELYLLLKRMIDKLRLNIGIAIDNLKPSQLKVIFVFEDIPNKRRLHKNELAIIPKDRYKDIRNMTAKVLKTRFYPPIELAKTKSGKYIKVVSKTLVNHLKNWH